jgi:flagellin
MLNSINTNVGAQIALQNLNATSQQLQTTQARINTGLKVANSKDNAAIWAIAQNQRSEMGAFNAVKESLQRGQSAVDVALSAGESISNLLGKMKEIALGASDRNLDANSRTALQTEFNSLAKQVTSFIQNANFNGVNLLDGSSANGYKALANAKGSSTVDVASENMRVRTTAGTSGSVTGNAAPTGVVAGSFTVTLDGGSAVTVNVANGDDAAAIASKTNAAVGSEVASVNSSGFLVFQSRTYGTGSTVAVGGFTTTTPASVLGAAPVTVAGAAAVGGGGLIEIAQNTTFAATTNYAALLKQIDDSVANVANAIGRMGSGSKAMESSLTFVSKLQDTLEAGIGNLVDADLAKESARLQSLQTKQQLGVQALAIANQSSGILLGLFR